MIQSVFLEISLDDYSRIIFGEGVDAWFILEIIFRTLFVYLLLIVAMRAMGTRMSSQLSRLELISLVCLAAAIGVPVLGTMEGLLPGLIIAIIVVVSQRVISHQHLSNEKLEKQMLGDLEILVEDGVYQLSAMRRATVSKDRLNAQLRSEGIYHTGQVSKLIIEANGSFSLVKKGRPMPGLPVIPDFDKEFEEEVFKFPGDKACTTCGKVRASQENTSCGHCNKTTSWMSAVLLKTENS
ncbi:DUF421 domain-containing protein [Pleomorphovibrio marinus]|uniref:DUF421 domain-containing protein n=1 Tax=Pleomorphovibrio marinus TaxID=2164132 RepID=UPI000E0B134C|nr:YetF domain-containing protein [Pleomorphovibrio marinus]